MVTRVLVVGGIGVDINVRLYDGQWPLPLGADTIFAQVGDPSLGHAGSGVALQAAALGCAVTVADVIGADEYGSFVRRELTLHGINLVSAIDLAGTRRSVNLVRPDGGRLSLHDPRHSYEMEPAPSLWNSALADKDWVHIVIVNWARNALRDARARGILTSTDVQDWDGYQEHHKEFAYGADVVFCSATNLGNPSDLARDIFTNGVARIVVVTRGSQGSLIYTPETVDNPIVTPAVVLPGLKIVDTNGAGDSHCAALMTAVLAGDSLEVAGRKAALVASYSASYPGTNDHLMSGEQLTDYILNS